MHEKRNEDEDTMRHAFIPQCGGIRLLAALLPLCICLWLTGCGARPDSGTLTPTRVDENTAFYLDISGKGVNADDLKYTIMGYIQSDAGLSMADAPGPDVLVIRVDVREIFAAGSSSLDARETLGTTATGVMLGTLVGGLAGGRSGALIGAGVGAAAISPTVIAYITSEFPPVKMGNGFAVYATDEDGVESDMAAFTQVIEVESEPSFPTPPIIDDDDYVPLPPQIVYEEEPEDNTVEIVACAAAAVVAALMAAFLIIERRKS